MVILNYFVHIIHVRKSVAKIIPVSIQSEVYRLCSLVFLGFPFGVSVLLHELDHHRQGVFGESELKAILLGAICHPLKLRCHPFPNYILLSTSLSVAVVIHTNNLVTRSAKSLDLIFPIDAIYLIGSR